MQKLGGGGSNTVLASYTKCRKQRSRGTTCTSQCFNQFILIFKNNAKWVQSCMSAIMKQSSLPGPLLKMAANPSPEVKAILKLTPNLTTALSNEPLGVANELLSKGLISDEIYSEVLMPTSSATRKAAIMIESARKVIKLTPSKFTEFLEILSELSCTMLVENLRSTYQSESAPATQILQGSQQFSMPSNWKTFTGTMPPSSENSVISQLNDRTIPFTDDAVSGEEPGSSWNRTATH